MYGIFAKNDQGSGWCQLVFRSARLWKVDAVVVSECLKE